MGKAALVWERCNDCWIGHSGSFAAAMVEESILPGGPGWWRLLVPAAPPSARADTPAAAMAAADAAWDAWCDGAGLAPVAEPRGREGPPCSAAAP